MRDVRAVHLHRMDVGGFDQLASGAVAPLRPGPFPIGPPGQNTSSPALAGSRNASSRCIEITYAPSKCHAQCRSGRRRTVRPWTRHFKLCEAWSGVRLGPTYIQDRAAPSFGLRCRLGSQLRRSPARSSSWEFLGLGYGVGSLWLGWLGARWTSVSGCSVVGWLCVTRRPQRGAALRAPPVSIRDT